MASQQSHSGSIGRGGKNGEALTDKKPRRNETARHRDADSLLFTPRKKPKDLVGLLLGYGARARRSALPVTHLRMEVFTPSGQHAIQIRFK